MKPHLVSNSGRILVVGSIVTNYLGKRVPIARINYRTRKICLGNPYGNTWMDGITAFQIHARWVEPKKMRAEKRAIHNPDNLAAAQINPPVRRYRLLDEDEIDSRRAHEYEAIERWDRADNSWIPRCVGSRRDSTYRTYLSRAELAGLP